ncbi:hypothetical protein TSUD_304890 [Trifolium subterraneum]|uniref:Uncharacterized protein n=1 Tax=Trifolium subterraneum TaxID=3900 RepID=A0A2Z6PN61_TRISU|nr:hypothetical protein TSUD_304890 [Trifolium subterraneum]
MEMASTSKGEHLLERVVGCKVWPKCVFQGALDWARSFKSSFYLVERHLRYRCKGGGNWFATNLSRRLATRFDGKRFVGEDTTRKQQNSVGGRDEWCWRLEDDGLFFVSSVYEYLGIVFSSESVFNDQELRANGGYLIVCTAMGERSLGFTFFLFWAASNKKIRKDFALIWHATIWSYDARVLRLRKSTGTGVKDPKKVVEEIKLLSWRWGLSRHNIPICLFYDKGAA